MLMNDDKDGADNNMGKMTSETEIEIQNYQKLFFAKNVYVP